MEAVWSVIESAPEAAAALCWRRWLGPSFDAVAASFLRRTERRVKTVPCVNGCGCGHRVVSASDGFAGVCDCGEGCEDIPLTADDVAVWEVNMAKLGRGIAKAFGCEAKDAESGLSRTRQVVSFSGVPLAVFLTIQNERENFHNVVGQLVAKMQRPFILLAPTSRFVDANSQSLLAGVKAGFFALETHVELLENGRLYAPKSGAKLFAAHLPEMKEIVLEPKFKQVFRLFGELLAMGIKWKASPALVFDLMVFKKMTRAETAVACKCVPSLITRRVQLIENHFHMPVEKLLAFASDIQERLRTVKGDPYAKKKHGAAPNEPEESNAEDNLNAQEDDDGYLPEERPKGY